MTPSDPLFAFQWYLRNTGQAGGTAGKDIDVLGAWNIVSGSGVRVLDIDTGIDFTNPDLAPNYDAATSQSVDSPFNSGYPFSTDGSSVAALSHGTETAGLIAAAANGVGIVGVAFNAHISSFRALNTLANARDPFGTLTLAFLASEHFDVANNSWGFSGALDDSVFSNASSNATAALLEAATNGRGGLGTINVFAAGNFYARGDNTNLHAFQSSINVVTVAALDANGTINAPGGRYSAPGSTILVSAPGTGIVSTTISGTGDFGGGNDNDGLDGTSFAAPLVTGVIALMLQANPGLGIRDVQQILAYTARKTDPTNPSWHLNHALNWNGGGLEVSNDYGFGLVDATAAVALAQSWPFQHTIGNRVINTVNVNPAPSGFSTGTAFHFEVNSSSDLTLNWARVQLSMAFTRFDNLTVTLTSPSGTSSVLLDRPDDGLGAFSFNNTVQLSSDQFWGERAIGEWTLTLGESNKTRGDSGTLFGATLVLVGDPPSADSVYVYTDHYAAEAAANAGRSILNDPDGGANTLDVAAVSSFVTISLTPGSSSTVAGTPLTIGSGTLITTAIAGNAGAKIVGNQFGDVLRSGAGDDDLEGGAGDDLIGAGAGTNFIDGGGGTNTASYTMNLSSARILNIGGTLHITGPGVSDTLVNIQFLRFNDGVIPIPPSSRAADNSILWQNDNGAAAIWTMRGTTLVGGGVIGLNPGTAWVVAGKADFFGDGALDILWRNYDGSIAIWKMQGTSIAGGALIGLNPGSAWEIAATADFNGDGKSDILWQNADGTIAIWNMSGAALIGGGIVGLNPGPTWHIRGAADFFGDGKTDILWQNDDGSIAIWQMNGTAITAGGLIGLNPGPSWHIRGTADFNGDGRADILWQNDNGGVAIWNMNGTSIGGGGLVGLNPGASWHVIGTADFSSAGTTDILWRADDGATAIWSMNGTSIASGGGLAINPAPDWHPSGSDQMRFISGTTGTALLTATPLDDAFVLTSFAPGAHVINGFSPRDDMIELSQSLFADFAAVRSHIVASGGGSMITLNGSATLFLAGVAPGALRPGDFAFV